MDESKKQESEFYNGKISVEDLTVMKLMEEIMEFDEEIKMKQRWINTRMKMLHKLLPTHQGKQTAQLIEKFMCSLQPEYPQKISVQYERPGSAAIAMPMDSGEAIPMRQADVFDKPIPMKQADVFDQPIPMMAQDTTTSTTNEEQKE